MHYKNIFSISLNRYIKTSGDICNTFLTHTILEPQKNITVNTNNY